MKYDPKDASTALPEGQYAASIHSVITTNAEGGPLTTRNGDPMERLEIEVYPDKGPNRTISDWITAKSAAWKYRGLAKAIGFYDAWKLGTFEPSDHIGANLTVELTVEESEQFGDRNTIKSYLPPATTASASRASSESLGIKDDDIPF
jgi:hypothetical protein